MRTHKRMSKERKIIRALQKGRSPKEISEYYNTSLNYVYKVRMRNANLIYPSSTQPAAVDPASAPEPGRIPSEFVGPPAPEPAPTLPAGLVTLHSEIPQPTAGIGPLPLGSGTVVEVKPVVERPKLTRWQQFKLWLWGRA